MADAITHLSAGRTRIEWLSQLNTEYKPKKEFRRTSIICTIGPKTNSVEKMNMLRKAGLNVVRMNFSHGSYEYHQSVIDNAREAERQIPGRPLAIALDTVRPDEMFRRKTTDLTLQTERTRDPNRKHSW